MSQIKAAAEKKELDRIENEKKLKKNEADNRSRRVPAEIERFHLLVKEIADPQGKFYDKWEVVNNEKLNNNRYVINRFSKLPELGRVLEEDIECTLTLTEHDGIDIPTTLDDQYRFSEPQSLWDKVTDKVAADYNIEVSVTYDDHSYHKSNDYNYYYTIKFFKFKDGSRRGKKKDNPIIFSLITLMFSVAILFLLLK